MELKTDIYEAPYWFPFEYLVLEEADHKAVSSVIFSRDEIAERLFSKNHHGRNSCAEIRPSFSKIKDFLLLHSITIPFQRHRQMYICIGIGRNYIYYSDIALIMNSNTTQWLKSQNRAEEEVDWNREDQKHHFSLSEKGILRLPKSLYVHTIKPDINARSKLCTDFMISSKSGEFKH